MLLIRWSFRSAVIGALLAAAIWLMDPLFLTLLGLALFWAGFGLGVLALILLLSALRTDRSLRPALILLAMVAAMGAFMGVAIPCNRLVQEQKVIAAKVYPGLLAPLLEAFRTEYGRYPANLDELPTKPLAPLLLRRANSYQSDGTRYFFFFAAPGGLIDTWNYDSDSRTWHLST